MKVGEMHSHSTASTTHNPADLCSRTGISRATRRRLKRGDPGGGTGAYLTALLILGVWDYATPALADELWHGNHGQRVRLSQSEKGEDKEYFQRYFAWVTGLRIGWGDRFCSLPRRQALRLPSYSTVTDLARFLGLSTSVPRARAV